MVRRYNRAELDEMIWKLVDPAQDEFGTRLELADCVLIEDGIEDANLPKPLVQAICDFRVSPSVETLTRLRLSAVQPPSPLTSSELVRLVAALTVGGWLPQIQAVEVLLDISDVDPPDLSPEELRIVQMAHGVWHQFSDGFLDVDDLEADDWFLRPLMELIYGMLVPGSDLLQ